MHVLNLKYSLLLFTRYSTNHSDTRYTSKHTDTRYVYTVAVGTRYSLEHAKQLFDELFLDQRVVLNNSL